MISFFSLFGLIFINLFSWPVLAVSASRRYLIVLIFNFLFLLIFLREKAFLLMALTLINYMVLRIKFFKPQLALLISVFITFLPLIVFLMNLKNAFIDFYVGFVLCFFCLQQAGAMTDILILDRKKPISIIHWFSFSLFFPTIIAGPICRWENLSESLLKSKKFTSIRGFTSVELFFTASFKKMVFAVPSAVMIQNYFSEPAIHGPIATIGISILLRFMFWAEISAYTDWARATAVFVGVKIPRNFDLPFATLRILDYWQHWHMSVSGWFRDYIFYPLLHKLRGYLKIGYAVSISIVISFSIFGLWHGISFTLLLMGLMKGVGVILQESLLQNKRFNKVRIVKYSVNLILMLIFVYLPTVLIKMDFNSFLNIFRIQIESSRKLSNALIHMSAFLSEQSIFGINKLVFVLFSIVLWVIIALKNNKKYSVNEINFKQPTLKIAIFVLLIFLWISISNFEEEIVYNYFSTEI